MRKPLLISVFWVSFVNLLIAQEDLAKYDFRLLRQEDELEGLIEAKEKSAYDRLKMNQVGENAFLSFGGSYRGQYEYFKNESFVPGPNKEDGWYLQRLLLHSNLTLGENFRFFGEVGSSLIYGKEFLSPVDEDELYVNQLFMEYRFEDWSVLVGRENVKLGSRRLVDPREGPNVRRSFDRISVNYQRGETNYNVFVGTPVYPRPGVFDNRDLHDEEYLFGLYVTKLLKSPAMLDVYYLGSHFNENTYSFGTADETRHSLGARLWRNTNKWSYDNEIVYQFGNFGDDRIRAWTASVKAWYRINNVHQIGFKTELISGTTSDERLGTFNALYPRGAYFGRVARFGPANLIDFHPYWTVSMNKFTFELDYDIFWRFSTNDGVYGPALNLVLDGESDSRFIAHQIGTITHYEFSPFFGLELETNYIFRGNLIEDLIPDSKDLFHLVLTAELRF